MYNKTFQIVMLDVGLLISLSIVFFPLTLLQTAVKEKKRYKLAKALEESHFTAA